MPEWVIEGEREGAREGARLDVFLAESLGVSRAEAQRLLAAETATVNDASAKANYRLRPGDRIMAERPEPTPASVAAEAIPLSIVYEDPDLIVIDKPRGMVVHPAPGSSSGTLVNAILAHAKDLSGIGGVLRPGIVHRLDKDTSGLMLVAKNDAAHLSLQAQIQAKTAAREYEAIVWGQPKFDHAEIDAAIGRDPRNRKKMAVTSVHSRMSVTELRVLERLGAFSFVSARLRTGRTHQIRVHCAYIGHPVVGDPLYGGMRKAPLEHRLQYISDRSRIEAAIAALGGQALHAARLAFDHPRTGERLEFHTPMPTVMQDLLDLLRSRAYLRAP